MKYLLEDVNGECTMTIELIDGFLCVECSHLYEPTGQVTKVYLSFEKEQVFELNGVLHHLHKQMK